MDLINGVFWLTGAAVWVTVGGCFILLLYGEVTYRHAANRFRRKHMSAEEYAILTGQVAAHAARNPSFAGAAENSEPEDPSGEKRADAPAASTERIVRQRPTGASPTDP
jgi:hypothetical protein